MKLEGIVREGWIVEFQKGIWLDNPFSRGKVAQNVKLIMKKMKSCKRLHSYQYVTSVKI